jgi:hypothetical protein
MPVQADFPGEERQIAAARRCLEQVQTGPLPPQLPQAVGHFSSLLAIHGLGQTMAYFQARGGNRPGSPYTLLLRCLGQWLHAALDLPAEDPLRALTEGDSRLYLEAGREARALVQALTAALQEVTK